MGYAYYDRTTGDLQAVANWPLSHDSAQLREVYEAGDLSSGDMPGLPEAVKPQRQRRQDRKRKAQHEQREAINRLWKEQCEKGLPVGEHRYGCSETDVGLLTAVYTLASLQIQKGLAKPEDAITLLDVDMKPVQMTYPELETLLLMYGSVRGQVSYEYGRALAAVRQADDDTAALAVSLPALL